MSIFPFSHSKTASIYSTFSVYSGNTNDAVTQKTDAFPALVLSYTVCKHPVFTTVISSLYRRRYFIYKIYSHLYSRRSS